MTQVHSSRAHARLAPSAAYRWMSCPGSVRMEAGFPDDRNSPYANEGTCAHELAAHCLQHDFDAARFLGLVIDINEPFGGKILKGGADGVTRFEVTEELVDAVEVYLDVVRSLTGRDRNLKNPAVIVEIEQKLDMTHLHPEIFGTGDAVVYQKNAAWLHVVDLKYGKGVVVDPVENPQLMLYGAGAVRRYKGYRIEGITLHIVQPRAPGSPVRSWQTDVLTLLEFEDEIRAKAFAVECALIDDWAGKEPTEWRGQFLEAGDHCRFCKAAATCPALRATAQQKALAEFNDGAIVLPDPATLTPDQMAAVLRDADLIGNWVKAVQEHAHAEAVAGRIPTGFKLVSKRATRKWKDEDEAAMMLAALAVDPWQEPKLKSPAQVEAAVGKKRFAALLSDAEDLGFEAPVTKVSSGTNLVPISDARQSVKSDGLLEFDAPDVGN
jgi:hypothetical protein